MSIHKMLTGDTLNKMVGDRMEELSMELNKDPECKALRDAEMAAHDKLKGWLKENLSKEKWEEFWSLYLELEPAFTTREAFSLEEHYWCGLYDGSDITTSLLKRSKGA